MDGTAISVAADFLEERGLFPDASAALRFWDKFSYLLDVVRIGSTRRKRVNPLGVLLDAWETLHRTVGIAESEEVAEARSDCELLANAIDRVLATCAPFDDRNTVRPGDVQFGEFKVGPLVDAYLRSKDPGRNQP